ncbi:hypothetical protein DL764_004326 [Monosporascus ibericus]|uniref:Uncharacterized protein n=1 Tax=Monosporascus ibericus TaxID=155417 RepID=A0A4Q4TD53_9PEZI|nr:hypothetical protein DL764_004326 [Monosporascus ibericus]
MMWNLLIRVSNLGLLMAGKSSAEIPLGTNLSPVPSPIGTALSTKTGLSSSWALFRLESAAGDLKSSSFKAGSVMSFLVSGGYDPEHLYVDLVREKEEKLFLKQPGANNVALLHIVWDTTGLIEWKGQHHLFSQYNPDAADWGPMHPSHAWPSRANGWDGQQFVTRDLFLREDQRLGSRPVAELDGLASGRTKRLGSKKVKDKTFRIGKSTLLTYITGNGTLTLDITNAGYGQAGRWEVAIAPEADNELTLDFSSIDLV